MLHMYKKYFWRRYYIAWTEYLNSGSTQHWITKLTYIHYISEHCKITIKLYSQPYNRWIWKTLVKSFTGFLYYMCTHIDIHDLSQIRGGQTTTSYSIEPQLHGRGSLLFPDDIWTSSKLSLLYKLKISFVPWSLWLKDDWLNLFWY